jgi:hypothetical protein
LLLKHVIHQSHNRETHCSIFFICNSALYGAIHPDQDKNTWLNASARALSLSPKLFCYYRHVNMAPALQYVGTSGPLATFSSGTILSYIRTYNCNSRIPLLHINYQQWLQQIRHDYNQIVHAIWHHLDSLTAVSRFFIQFKTVQRVNDTRGHVTCFACALKSQILQTRLTGQTICEICASEVTNRSIIRSIAE